MSIWNNRGMIVTVTFVITLAIIRHLCEVTFFVVSTERRRLTTSFRQTEDENDSCKKVIHLLVRTDKTEFFQQSVLLKYF